MEFSSYLPVRIGLLVKFDPPAPLTCIGRFVRAADQFKIPSRNDPRSLRKILFRACRLR